MDKFHQNFILRKKVSCFVCFLSFLILFIRCLYAIVYDKNSIARLPLKLSWPLYIIVAINGTTKTPYKRMFFEASTNSDYLNLQTFLEEKVKFFFKCKRFYCLQLNDEILNSDNISLK